MGGVRSPLSFVHVSETALKGRVGVVFWRLKAESRDEGDFPGHQVRAAGPQGRCARAGGQGVIHSGLLEVSGDVPKSTHE